MALDLSGVRRVVEGLLDDELQLWRDADGAAGDDLDEATGELRPDGAAPVLVWEGLGAITRPGQLVGVPPFGGAVAALPAPTAYQALLPLSLPAVQVDDVVRVSRSVRDAQLTDRRFRVTDIGVGTYAVVRVVQLKAVT
ncbi:DUF6093 family protein [Streptomyces sp. MUM 2J]|uniref:DUF6093 family protein n=1 Tax=Streptomyces sp. MUM 2J TaxID=2791987 RepID=UPI001F042956|nr:DUF6093 family protein [Streptomyces sp. MUM 2J]MCH0562148.1 hypothetical protein [Streptomyces sp. MUM 2J]